MKKFSLLRIVLTEKFNIAKDRFILLTKNIKEQ